MTQQPLSTVRRKATMYAGLGSAVAGTVAGAVFAAQWFSGVWNGTPYPVAVPAATAQRLDERTQAVYDELGLSHATLDRDWPGGMDAGGYDCHPVGLRHFFDNLRDTPTSEPQVVDVHNDWALKGVSLDEAVPALERVRAALTGRGWTVTEYRRTPSLLEMRLKAPGGSDRVTIESYPGNRLQVAASADCARYPAGTPLDSAGNPRLPSPQAPSVLRG
ncbi:hypothetical protein ACFPFX_17975 [Streptomyces mauvecolor]|uniref:Uncharacterized protein n=1 Tax=Streptomyces mauvecolor TaxID=58345 RepID=A0ABV9UQX5_9ACTN